MTEKLLEQKHRNAIKKLGGLSLKFVSPSYSGVPDRIVLMPKMNCHFVEFKRPGKGLSPRQEYVIDKLRKMGYMVWVINGQLALDLYLNSYDAL